MARATAAPAKRKRSDGERRREQIILAATVLFAQRGVAGTGMDQIGEAAGITGSGVYRHFESKEALLEAVMDRTLEVRTRRDRTPEAAPRSGREALAALVDELVVGVLRNRDGAAAVWRALRHLDAGGTEWIDRLHGQFVAEFTAALVRARPGLGADQARTRVDAVYGLVLSAAEFDTGLPAERLRGILGSMAVAILLA